MPYDVTMPDGTVIHDVPDGTTKAQLQAKYQAAHKPTSFWQGVGEEATRIAQRGSDFLDRLNPINYAADAALKAVGLDQNKVKTANRAALAQKFAASPYRGSEAGKTVGQIAATLPTMLLPGGPVVQGIASGALASHSNKPLGIAKDAAIGGALGKAGQVATSGLARVVGGKVVPKNVRLLADEGVTMTPGMRAGQGSLRNWVEDKVLGTVAPVIPNTATARAFNDLRGAVANRVLKPIGESVPKGTPIDREFMGQIQDRVYGALDDAAGNLSLQVDPALAASFAATKRSAPRLVGAEAAKQVTANADHLAARAQQPISGQQLRDTLSELRGIASKSEGALKDQLWGLHDDVVDALARQNSGEAVQTFNNARESATLLARMNDAAAKVDNGEFGPTQLLQAARRRGFGTSTANVASGEARLMDLADAAADVMRNKTANSGTIPRGLAVGALAGGGPVALGTINPVAGALAGSQLFGYVPGLAEVLQNAALNRPQVLRSAGSALDNAAPYVGRLTAGAAPLLTPGLSALLPQVE